MQAALSAAQPKPAGDACSRGRSIVSPKPVPLRATPARAHHENASPRNRTEMGQATSMAPPRATVYAGPSGPRASANPKAVKYAPSHRPAPTAQRRPAAVGNATWCANGASTEAEIVATARTASPAPLASFSRLMSAFQMACNRADTRTRTAARRVTRTLVLKPPPSVPLPNPLPPPLVRNVSTAAADGRG